MPILSWGARRQLAVFAVFAIAVFLIIGGLIYYFRPAPSCFDNKQNQDEEGIDCGGEIARCAPCSEKIHDLTVLWTRFFMVRDGVYDVAAMVQNGNQFLKTEKFIYAVKLYDENNVLISIRESSTFIEPGERFVVFEPGLVAQNRVPKTALFEMRSVSWSAGEYSPLRVAAAQKKILLTDTSSPRLEVILKNQANESYKNIEAEAVVTDGGGAVLGVSKTIIDKLGIDESKTIVFTWPKVIEGVAKAEILLRQAP